jgi:Raf kinase inhibitor-like YbhB/YbcL family protein
MKFLAMASMMLMSLSAFSAGFSLTSSSLNPKKEVPMKYVFNGMGCTGENISPALSWSGAPAGTKSFIVTAYDPDAPTGSGWWHWTVVNIPADVMSIEEGASGSDKMPKGSMEGRTDFGKSGWGGPCPPVGDKPHRYVFTVYAMDKDKIDVSEDAPAAQVGFNANNKPLAKASFTVKFGRK